MQKAPEVTPKVESKNPAATREPLPAAALGTFRGFLREAWGSGSMPACAGWLAGVFVLASTPTVVPAGLVGLVVLLWTRGTSRHGFANARGGVVAAAALAVVLGIIAHAQLGVALWEPNHGGFETTGSALKSWLLVLAALVATGIVGGVIGWITRSAEMRLARTPWGLYSTFGLAIILLAGALIRAASRPAADSIHELAGIPVVGVLPALPDPPAGVYPYPHHVDETAFGQSSIRRDCVAERPEGWQCSFAVESRSSRSFDLKPGRYAALTTTTYDTGYRYFASESRVAANTLLQVRHESAAYLWIVAEGSEVVAYGSARTESPTVKDVPAAFSPPRAWIGSAILGLVFGFFALRRRALAGKGHAKEPAHAVEAERAVHAAVAITVVLLGASPLVAALAARLMF